MARFIAEFIDFPRVVKVYAIGGGRAKKGLAPLTAQHAHATAIDADPSRGIVSGIPTLKGNGDQNEVD